MQRLWEVCQLPDYRKIAPAQHAELIGELFGFLADGGVVPDDWIAGQVRSANRTDGDIDTLSSRIAHIRTWTFVANQPDWLADPVDMARGDARRVEDALSDALHERLTKRFVDRRTSVLMRRLKGEHDAGGRDHAGRRRHGRGPSCRRAAGLPLHARSAGRGRRGAGAARRRAEGACRRDRERAERLSRAGDRDIVLSLDGYLRWQGEPVARLVAGDDVLKPRFVILADEQLSGPPRELVEARLAAWLSSHIGDAAEAALRSCAPTRRCTGMARGIAFRLVENLGILERRDVPEEVRGLDQEARAGLRRHGVRFGAYHIYIPALLKPAPSTLLAQLWALKHSDLDVPGLAELAGRFRFRPHLGQRSTRRSTRTLYRRFGFRIYGKPRRPHRHPGAPRRPHPPGPRLAPGCDGRAARRAPSPRAAASPSRRR